MSAATLPAPAIAVAPPRPAVNPWAVALTLTLATFMELLDTSIANVALPHIAGGLSVGVDESTWVLTSYLVANAVVLPMSAWLSRVFGRKNYYMLCVALFTAASFLCGTATSLGQLIFYRVLQGVAGGGLAPCEQAMLVDAFPPAKRAAAFGLYALAIVVAPAVGPPFGGWITDSYSWHWVFFINVPIGILSLVLTSRLVSDPPEFAKEVAETRRGGMKKVDVVGIALIAIGFGCLEVALDKGQREDWLESPLIIGFLAVAVVCLAAAVVWETRHPDPVVDLSLLKERNFSLACAFYFIFGFVLFGSTVMAPQMFQSLFGYTATQAGLTIMPGAVVVVCMMPFIVKLTPKVGPKAMIGFGFCVLAFAIWRYTRFDLNVTFGMAVRARMLFGFGLAFLFVPVSQVAYSYLPKDKNNKASSLTNLFRNQGGSFGIAFVTTMLERRQQFHQTVLAPHVSAYDSQTGQTLRQLTGQLARAGLSVPQAMARAQAQLYAMVQRQTSMLAFLDCFFLLSLLAAAALPMVFFIKKFNSKAGGGAAH